MRVEKRGLQLIRICLLPPTPQFIGGHLTGSVARRSTFFIFRIPLMVHTIGFEPITQSVFLQDASYDFTCRAYKFTLLITICEMRAYGASGETRTRTPLRIPDP